MVVGKDRIHLGLLEHHFRHPDVIGSVAVAPGKWPMAGFEPVDKRLNHLDRLSGGRELAGARFSRFAEVLFNLLDLYEVLRVESQ